MKKDLLDCIPLLLRERMLDRQAFVAALEKEYMTLSEDGCHVVWNLGSKTLLAYFCGRMWCGDTPVYSDCAHGYIWQFGEGRFPKRDLVNLFDVGNLRVLRAQRIMALLPEGWERIENIFQKSSKV